MDRGFISSKWTLMCVVSWLLTRSRTIAMTDQGIMNNTNDEAIVQAGVNPDFGVQDLYDSIAAGNYPSWTIYWQTMTPQQAENYKCMTIGFIWFPQADANIFPRQRSRPDQRYDLLSPNYILDTYISISRMARRRCTSTGNWSDHPCSEPVRICSFRYSCTTNLVL